MCAYSVLCTRTQVTNMGGSQPSPSPLRLHIPRVNAIKAGCWRKITVFHFEAPLNLHVNVMSRLQCASTCDARLIVVLHSSSRAQTMTACTVPCDWYAARFSGLTRTHAPISNVGCLFHDFRLLLVYSSILSLKNHLIFDAVKKQQEAQETAKT